MTRSQNLHVGNPRVPLAPRIFRAIFKNWRPRGHMRLGSWMARLTPDARYVPISFGAAVLWLDLASIDHQPAFLDGCYPWDREELALIPTLLHPGDIAVDVGANLGAYTTTCALVVGESGLVLAYEPNPEMLWMNASTHTQVIVRPFAVAEVAGTVTLRVERANTYSHIVPGRPKGRRDREVRAVRLDDEIRRLRIPSVNFLKVDVEGYEENVFAGAARLLSSPTPPVLMFEHLPEFSTRWQRGALAVLADFAGAEWAIFRIGWSRGPAELPSWSAVSGRATIVAVPNSRSSISDRLRQVLGLVA